jgi:hypothetical protein
VKVKAMSRGMQCPFPGMDPYLEDPAFWPDFHAKFINYWQEHIADRVPSYYEVRVGERVCIVEERPDAKKLTGPDVAISRATRRKSQSQHRGAAAGTQEPVTIPFVVLDQPREGYLEILHRPDRELVAVLELLSPGNKENPGRHTYMAKRNALWFEKVHIIELDLLLLGHLLPLDKPLPQDDYFYLVHRSNYRPDCNAFSWGLRDPLPTVPVPLLPGDADVMCDLAAVFATTFERRRYRPSLRYGKAPVAKLSPDSMRWIKERLRATKS